jgi:hypothetical protein
MSFVKSHLANVSFVVSVTIMILLLVAAATTTATYSTTTSPLSAGGEGRKKFSDYSFKLFFSN